MDTAPAPKTHQNMPMFDDPISSASEDENRMNKTTVKSKVVAVPLRNSMRLPQPRASTSRSGLVPVETRNNTTNRANNLPRQPQSQEPTASVVFDRIDRLSNFRRKRWLRILTQVNARRWTTIYQRIRDAEERKYHQAQGKG